MINIKINFDKHEWKEVRMSQLSCGDVFLREYPKGSIIFQHNGEATSLFSDGNYEATNLLNGKRYTFIGNEIVKITSSLDITIERI